MKTLFNVFVVFTLALGLSACGGGKGGVNETGVEANGKCSKNFMSDIRTSANDMSNSVRASDLKGAYNACNKVTEKYGAKMTCVSPETGRTFKGADHAKGCEDLKKVAGIK